MPLESLESLPNHVRWPHLRPIQPIPVQQDGKQFLALRDPQMLQARTLVVPPQVLNVLKEFKGEKSIDQITEQYKANLEQIIQLTKGLDELGLLWGPNFERLESEALQRIKQEGFFPANSSNALGADEQQARETIKKFFDQTENPELEMTGRGIVAPHLDYDRGWPNYAGAYYAFQDQMPPDRVVLLGTNHFGLGDGVVFTDCGFTSPLGKSQADRAVADHVIQELGDRVVIDQLDFLAEHSIELHLPWLQYCFGNVPVVAALIPDPCTPPENDDEQRISTDDFLAVLGSALSSVGGSTFFIASADLSHVGPQFGEPRAVNDQRRFDIERHDREMMGKYLTGDVEDFLEAMRWNKNPTRWCSIGNMSAILRLTQADEIELIDYRQAVDEKGLCLVSSAAMVLD